MRTKARRGIARHGRLPTLTGGSFSGAAGCCGLNPTTAASFRPASAGPRNRMPSRHAAHAAPPSRPATPSGSTLAARNANPSPDSVEQSETDRPVTLTGVPSLSPVRGAPGKLTVKTSAPSSQKHISSMQYSGSPFTRAHE